MLTSPQNSPVILTENVSWQFTVVDKIILVEFEQQPNDIAISKRRDDSAVSHNSNNNKRMTKLYHNGVTIQLCITIPIIIKE
jgi:hypothetical protein